MFDADETRLSRLVGEKKIDSLPTIRIEEGMRAKLQGLADIEGVTESELVRIAISRFIDDAEKKYEAMHNIFAGRSSASNVSRASQCIATNEGEI